MILSARTIRELHLIRPMEAKGRQRGMSYGLSHCGYDIRVHMPDPISGHRFTMMPGIGQGILLDPGQSVLLGTRGTFSMPDDVAGFVKDKSTWARQGLFNAQAVLEPGWCGSLSVRVANHGEHELAIIDGDPIAQVVFMRLDRPSEFAYAGKYQGQETGPQPARFD